jgi:hypothetical protein
MKAFYRGLLLIIVALIAVPFVTGFIQKEGSFDCFLDILSGALLFTGILLIIRARLRQAILLIALSLITFLSSNKIIHWNMYILLYGSYSWTMILLILLLIIIVVLAISRQ